VSEVLVNALVVLVLVLFGGVFSAAELALVSLRESQVKALAERSRRGQRVARLVADPNRFLAAVQIGVTLAGFLSSAVGAVTLSAEATAGLVRLGLAPRLAEPVALVGVTLVISYVSLVLGELVPKRLALQRTEGIALALARPLALVATLCRPVIWLLSRTTDLVVRLFGGDPGANREAITEEELRDLVAAHESLGGDERRLIDEVFAAGERQVREVMLPRTEVEFLDAGLTVTRAARIAAASSHSRFPVARDSQDDVVGFVHIRDLLVREDGDRTLVIERLARDVKRLPGTKRVLAALSEMRREGHHLAIVVDEYGGTDGIVTLEDLIEEVIGEVRDEFDPADHDEPARREEVDGLLNLGELEEQTGLRLPDGPYETVAGFVMAARGAMPTVGDSVECEGYRLTVTELDGRRVSRVKVERPDPAVDPETPRRAAAPEDPETPDAPPASGGTGEPGAPEAPAGATPPAPAAAGGAPLPDVPIGAVPDDLVTARAAGQPPPERPAGGASRVPRG